MRTSASAVWRNGKLEFNAFGWGPVRVNDPDGTNLYASGGV